MNYKVNVSMSVEVQIGSEKELLDIIQKNLHKMFMAGADNDIFTAENIENGEVSCNISVTPIR